jgi:hypothetical protein
MKKGGKLLDFHMGHFRELERTLLGNQDIRLVVIDPAGAYIGRAGVNENHDADLRAILGPLSEIANRTGATVILIKHLNKSAGASAVQRVGGSAGYVNACRFAFMVAPDLDDKDLKLMLPFKANVLPSGTTGLSYRMEPIPDSEALVIITDRWPKMPLADATALAKQLFRQRWESGVTADADTVSGRKGSSQRRESPAKEKVAECADFIRRFLRGYSWPDKQIQQAAKDAGFSERVYFDAKQSLRCDQSKTPPQRYDAYHPLRLSSSNLGRGLNGEWWQWIGPQGSPAPDRPASLIGTLPEKAVYDEGVI